MVRSLQIRWIVKSNFNYSSLAHSTHSQRNAFLRNYTEDYLVGFLGEILGAEEGASYSLVSRNFIQ